MAVATSDCGETRKRLSIGYFFLLLLILRMASALSIIVRRECSFSALPLQSIQPSFDLSMIFPFAQVKMADKISGGCPTLRFSVDGFSGLAVHSVQYSLLMFVSIDNV
jgi:hypothetical protein